MQHPDDTDDFLGLDAPQPKYPDYTMTDAEVESIDFDYSDRAPGDWIISGPLGNGPGPGRRFATRSQAARWVRLRYGARLKRPVEEAFTGGRWAWLIRGTAS